MTQVNTRRPPQVTQEGKTDPFVHDEGDCRHRRQHRGGMDPTMNSEKHRGPEALKRHARRRVKGRVRSPNWQVASGQSGFWETSTSLRKLACGAPPCSSSPRKRGPRACPGMNRGRALSLQLPAKITPLPIMALDQLQFPRAPPFLDALFAEDASAMVS